MCAQAAPQRRPGGRRGGPTRSADGWAGLLLETGAAGAGFGGGAVTSGRRAACGAETPWKLVRCVFAGGTSETGRRTSCSAVTMKARAALCFGVSSYRPSSRRRSRDSSRPILLSVRRPSRATRRLPQGVFESGFCRRNTHSAAGRRGPRCGTCGASTSLRSRRLLAGKAPGHCGCAGDDPRTPAGPIERPHQHVGHREAGGSGTLASLITGIEASAHRVARRTHARA